MLLLTFDATFFNAPSIPLRLSEGAVASSKPSPNAALIEPHTLAAPFLPYLLSLSSRHLSNG